MWVILDGYARRSLALIRSKTPIASASKLSAPSPWVNPARVAHPTAGGGRRLWPRNLRGVGGFVHDGPLNTLNWSVTHVRQG